MNNYRCKIIPLTLFLFYELLVLSATALFSIFFRDSIDANILVKNTPLTIIGLIIPVLIYTGLANINVYFKISAIIYVLLEIDVIYYLITGNIFEHSMTDIIALQLGTGLELILDYFFIKGLANIYMVLKNGKAIHIEKELKYYKIVFILIFIISVLASLLEGVVGAVLLVVDTLCLAAVFVERLIFTLKVILLLKNKTNRL